MREIANFSCAMGQVIRGHREKRNWARKRLAGAAGAIGGSESYLKLIEGGKRNPTVTVLVLLSEAFGLEPEDLLRQVRRRQAYLDDKQE